MEKSTSASHENDPRFKLPVEPETDISLKSEQAKSNLRLVTDFEEGPAKKRSNKFFLKRSDNTLFLGKKEIDLSIDGREPSYPARGKNVFVFGFGNSVYKIFKEKGKLYGQAILFGKERPRVQLESDWSIVNEINVFKGNVKFNSRLETAEDAPATGDVQLDEVPDKPNAETAGAEEQAGLVVPLRESTEPAYLRDDTRGSSVEKIEMRVHKDFDDLISSPPRGVETVAPADESVTPEQKVFISETIADARATSVELLQSLADEGKDEDYYASLSIEYSTEDKEAVARGVAARTYGTSSTGGDGSRYAVPETLPVQHENRTALVGVVTEAGRLGAAVIEATTPRALEGARGIVAHGLAQERFSLTTVFDAARRLLSKKAKTAEKLSAAAITVSPQGEVIMASMGDTAVLMVREGKKVELVDQKEPVPTKDFPAKGEADAKGMSELLETKMAHGKDHDQVIAATKRFWDLVSEYEVEKYAKRYRGEALQKVLFNLAYDRNNAVVPFVIETSPNEKKYEQPAKGEGESIALQVTHVELPEQRGFLSKLGRSKAGTWLRSAALVAFGFSAQGKLDTRSYTPDEIAAIQKAPEKMQPSTKQAVEKITVENRRGNEHELVRLVDAVTTKIKLLGSSPEDNGRKVLIAAWMKKLLRGEDAGGFKAADFNRNIQHTRDGKFSLSAPGLELFIADAAGAAKEKKHISTAIKYAETTYKLDFGSTKSTP